MANVVLDFDLPQILPNSLPLVPLRRGVLLPGAVTRFGVGRSISRAALDASRDQLVLVGVQREPVADPVPSDLLPIATLARVVERPKGGVVLQGIRRVTLTGFSSTRPYMDASFDVISSEWPDTAHADGLNAALREALIETAQELGVPENRVKALMSFVDTGLLADAAASFVDSPAEFRTQILQTSDPIVRAEKVLEAMIRIKEVVSAKKAIRERVEKGARDQQKEHVLRAQLKAIQDELGGDEEDDLSRLRSRLAESELPEEVRDTVDRELRRLERVNPNSPERNVAIDWLEWIADMPWGTESAVDVDLDTLEKALDRSHHGLEDVKRQVVEHLAVRKLAGRGRADVLLLVGPPGVGKTSIGQAIADATGRKLVRVALGGLHDEAELRGHRRTYIGARPGRLLEGIRRAGTSDPVILLDEIDKVGQSYRGNPSAALLEILDPEQNHAFTDHYLEVPFDLSRALFVATANDLSTIPRPLLDRLERLEIAGYSREEKLVIAQEHLLETLAENAGLETEDVVFTDAALVDAIDGWTRESGVRQLQRVLGKVYRAAAVKKARGELDGPLQVDVDDLPTYLKRRRFQTQVHELPDRAGIATGLAWTPVGGDVLYIETSKMPGQGNLVLTGQLGDVMKESARAALTYVLSNHQELGIPVDDVKTHDLHIHVPAGGTPKDGPSAGVTIFTAVASLLSGRPVRRDVAMTGEATLRGRVLPVGGIKSKVLAAHRRGITTILLPQANEPDLEDLPQAVRDQLDIVLVRDMHEVLAVALESAEEAAQVA